MTDTLKILHSSDWHLGRTLYGRRRHAEFAAFLDWLLEQLRQEKIDVLLLAGDIFDNSTPGTQAQSLYYNFLHRAASVCRHIVIVAGNHDSPAFLEAPAILLKSMNIHVIGNLPENMEDVVLALPDSHGVPELLVCALPYLRDKDLRLAEDGESFEDKERKLLEGMADKYAQASAIALKKQAEILAKYGRKAPIAATGHLFAAGGQTVEGDGVRELYVGSLSRARADIFPPGIDYLALGHLHIPQKLGGNEARRYSGSPLPMGFGECRQQKILCLAEFARPAPGQPNAAPSAPAPEAPSPETCAPAAPCLPAVRAVPVPVFQRLEHIKGNWAEIFARILELKAEGESVWLEVAYNGEEIPGNLREQLEELTGGSSLEILRVRNSRASALAMEQLTQDETLADLRLEDVFERCLDMRKVPEEQKKGLRAAYQEISASLNEKDREGAA